MTNVDLGPVLDRLDWTKGHARRVRNLSGVWAASALQETTTLRPDGVQVYRAEVVTEPPTDIALALGDVLQQARATLDNLVVALLPGPPTRQHGFRIVTRASRFDAAPGCLDGVPGWAVDVFRGLQPVKHNLAGRLIGYHLADLHALAIADRHHALLLSGAVIDMDQVWVGTTHPEGPSQFRVQERGRVLTLEAPGDARLEAHVAAAVLVQEERLRWKLNGGRYPWYPSADELADMVLRAVEEVVRQVRWAADREGVNVAGVSGR